MTACNLCGAPIHDDAPRASVALPDRTLSYHLDECWPGQVLGWSTAIRGQLARPGSADGPRSDRARRELGPGAGLADRLCALSG